MKIDLLESLRGIEGFEIEGELTVDLDPGQLAEPVCEAIAAKVAEGLEQGLAPDGTALEPLSEASIKRHGPHRRGYLSGELASSYVVEKTPDGAQVRTPLVERHVAVYGDKELTTDALMQSPEVDEAVGLALRKALGDE